MQYGLICLVLFNVLVMVASVGVYLRQRSLMDVEKHDRINWGIKIEGAVSTANNAKDKIDLIELSHYKKLLVKHEEQALEIVTLKNEVVSLRNEVIGLRTKLASEARTVRREAEKQTEPIAQDLGSVVASGRAFPLQVPEPAPSQQPRRQFGVVPKGSN